MPPSQECFCVRTGRPPQRHNGRLLFWSKRRMGSCPSLDGLPLRPRQLWAAARTSCPATSNSATGASSSAVGVQPSGFCEIATSTQWHRPERGSLQCGQEGISGPIGAPSAREISRPGRCEGSATAANREAAEKRGEASLAGQSSPQLWAELASDLAPSRRRPHENIPVAWLRLRKTSRVLHEIDERHARLALTKSPSRKWPQCAPARTSCTNSVSKSLIGTRNGRGETRLARSHPARARRQRRRRVRQRNLPAI